MGILIDDFATGRNTTPVPFTSDYDTDKESFTWKSKIQNLIPNDWKLKDDWASSKANIYDILSHASGLPRCLMFPELFF